LEHLPFFPVVTRLGGALITEFGNMKDFAAASFSPEVIQAMSTALQDAIDTLPEPVSSHMTHRLAETILRLAREGERDPSALQRLALLELQIGPER
jgi:hypothetical protein